MEEITQAIIKYICYLSLRNVTSSKPDWTLIENELEKDFVSSGADTIS